MSKVKVLVVEDEIIIADGICDTLEELGYQALEPAINYTEAIEIIIDEEPDIAILDVQLSGKKTGIDVARRIREDFHFPFIFLTSNSDSLTLNEAKEVRPQAFLVKPFSKEELYTSIEIALHNFAESKIKEDDFVEKDSIFVKEKGVYTKLKFDDILYLKSSHVYVELYLINGKKILLRRGLNDVLNSLNNYFIRVQRSFVVNIKYISEVKSNSLKIAEKEEIPIGKMFKEGLIKRMNRM
ncbi:LytR/AlgR family response regulator transcription factor [Polaribacter sargassicola]|uniref:LytR/AlgR family response regulator transcription factor n=1 Tax=Polaribacter sargassicola TaxID=2836891 RepID=UPI001F191FA9|nr:response regulator transcription factor [Polaribacter sp. DS7-9]MCG1034876.1 response regulator transcription factor [Polaribacter sp. DS7-9]